jgi:hypothetical protein
MLFFLLELLVLIIDLEIYFVIIFEDDVLILENIDLFGHN